MRKQKLDLDFKHTVELPNCRFQYGKSTSSIGAFKFRNFEWRNFRLFACPYFSATFRFLSYLSVADDCRVLEYQSSSSYYTIIMRQMYKLMLNHDEKSYSEIQWHFTTRSCDVLSTFFQPLPVSVTRIPLTLLTCNSAYERLLSSGSSCMETRTRSCQTYT